MSVLTRFCRNRSGNFGMLTALLIAPLLTVAGIAVDFGNAIRVKAELAGAADVAVLGAISEQSPAVIAAITSNANGKISAAEATGLKLFNGNWKQNNPNLDVTANVSVVKSGGKFVSVITYSTEIKTTFLSVIGKTSIPVSGKATAGFDTATFQSFYILVDNSPSMGVAATQADIDKMVANTPDQCAFACHIVNNGADDQNSYYHLARRLGVSTRIDVVALALASLTQTAKNVRRYSDQFAMGIYTFGEKAETMALTEVQKSTTNLSKAKQSAADVGLMSIPWQLYNKDQQTNFDTNFGDISHLMGVQGAGTSAADPEKILFFVSDGLGDSNKPVGCTQTVVDGTRCQEPIDNKLCKAIKDKGIRIAVLYTTYLPLRGNWWYDNTIAPFQPQIATKMKDCASPGLFFEVSPTEGISEAMTALFMKVVNTPILQN
jgi:Flp pilus assembly protein TadG